MGDVLIGPAVTTPAAAAAKVDIVGASASTGSALIVKNSTPTTLFEIKNNQDIQLGSSGGKIGLFGVTPVVKPTALTTQLTTITATAPGTPDYAIQDLTQTLPYGFVTSDEAQSFLKVVANLQIRVAELETKLQGLGILT